VHAKAGAVPDRDTYYMMIAMAVRARANCVGNRVGAIIVVEDRIVSTGYNGTPSDMGNCLDGGCHRCANRESFRSGTGYDVCIRVHAEQNTLLAAARFGISVQGGTVYTTLQPCFGCIKEMLQAKIERVYYLHDWVYPDKALQGEYKKIENKFPKGVKKLALADPDETWALSSKRAPAGVARDSDDTGHAAG